MYKFLIPNNLTILVVQCNKVSKTLFSPALMSSVYAAVSLLNCLNTFPKSQLILILLHICENINYSCGYFNTLFNSVFRETNSVFCCSSVLEILLHYLTFWQYAQMSPEVVDIWKKCILSTEIWHVAIVWYHQEIQKPGQLRLEISALQETYTRMTIIEKKAKDYYL